MANAKLSAVAAAAALDDTDLSYVSQTTVDGATTLADLRAFFLAGRGALLNGAIDPTTEGEDGDFYLNSTDFKVFGPKATTWPAGVDMLGADGAAGGTTLALNARTADYTLVLGDLGKLVRMNKATAISLTVPPYSAVAFGVGDTVTVIQMGAGATTIVAGAGVTLNRQALTSLVLSGQFAVVTLINTAQDLWDVIGGLTSTAPVSQAVSIATADLPINYALGAFVDVTLNAAITTITLTNLPADGTKWIVTIRFVADGTARAITYAINGVTAKWDGGTPPTAPSVSGTAMIVQLSSADVSVYVDGLLVAQAIS